MSDVRLELSGLVATVTLARESRRNALDDAFAAEVRDALTEAAEAGSRVVVLRSSAPVFCAGVDLSGPIRLDPGSPDLVVADALLSCGLYAVMAVEGPVLAGGLLFAALCPVVVAGADASFWLPERAIGIFPGRVLAYLEEVVPARAAHWLGVTEQRLDAAAAVRLGLASEEVPAGTAAARATALAHEVASTAPGFVEAARDAWAARFRTAHAVTRREQLDELLAGNVALANGHRPV